MQSDESYLSKNLIPHSIMQRNGMALSLPVALYVKYGNGKSVRQVSNRDGSLRLPVDSRELQRIGDSFIILLLLKFFINISALFNFQHVRTI